MIICGALYFRRYSLGLPLWGDRFHRTICQAPHQESDGGVLFFSSFFIV